MSGYYVDVLQVGAGMMLLIFLGWILARSKILLPSDFSTLNVLTSKLGLPILLFSSLSKNTIDEISFMPFFIILLTNICCHLVLCVIFVLPVKNRLETFVRSSISCCYLNFIVIGLPIFVALWGQESSKVTVVCPFVHYFFVGPMYLILCKLLKIRKEKEDENEFIGENTKPKGLTFVDFMSAIWSSIKSPLLIGSFVGIMWSVTRIKPPTYLSFTSMHFGNLVVVFSLMSIGSFLNQNSIVSCHWLQLLADLVLRFIISPLFAIGWCLLLKLDATLARQCTILSAMPISTIAFVLATSYGYGVEETSSMVFWSVALVVPVIMMWFSIMDGLNLFVEEVPSV